MVFPVLVLLLLYTCNEKCDNCHISQEKVRIKVGYCRETTIQTNIKK